MKRKISAIVMIVLALSLLLLAGCQCSHEWAEATCIVPKTCTLCEETEGEALGHDWQDADCTTPKNCARCDETEGEPLGHDYEEATCTEPKTCNACGEVEGEALGHSIDSWETTVESTCTVNGTQTGTCAVCGEKVDEELTLAEHQAGEWEVTKEVTASSDGERSKKCVNCGEVLETETFTKTAAEIKEEYTAKCKDYTYNEIARNPDDFIGEYARIKGEVIQVMEDGDEYTLRVNITQGSYYWSDTILVSYTKQSSDEARILEDDIVMMYGMLGGTYTYESVLGAEITVPLLFAEYIDIQ